MCLPTGAHPAGVTELLSVRHQIIAVDQQRNVVVKDEMMVAASDFMCSCWTSRCVRRGARVPWSAPWPVGVWLSERSRLRRSTPRCSHRCPSSLRVSTICSTRLRSSAWTSCYYIAQLARHFPACIVTVCEITRATRVLAGTSRTCLRRRRIWILIAHHLRIATHKDVFHGNVTIRMAEVRVTKGLQLIARTSVS